MKKILFVFLLLNLTGTVNAQAWKSVRHEGYFSVGASNFFGDLGGGSGDGAHGILGIKDLKTRSTRPTLMVGYKYMLNPYLAVKGSLAWSLLSGDDAITKNNVRKDRNLSFRSHIGEIAAYFEYFPFADKINPRYKLRGIAGNRAFSLTPFFFGGVGATFFNPKANYNGKWVALQPLGTEGQGLGGRPDKYKRYTLVFPIGVGVKYRIDKRMAISFELSLRYTLSDYLDDVSTSYYLPGEIEANYGADAAALSDRSGKPGDYGVIQYVDGRNNYLQRGDPRYNDAYTFGMFSFHYRFMKGQVFVPKF